MPGDDSRYAVIGDGILGNRLEEDLDVAGPVSVVHETDDAPPRRRVRTGSPRYHRKTTGESSRSAMPLRMIMTTNTGRTVASSRPASVMASVVTSHPAIHDAA